jgi:hypothetical protein
VKPHRIPRFGARFRLFRWGRRRDLADLVATVFPEFIARNGQERADGCRQGGKRRVVRPAGAAEDTARRALMARGRALQSRPGDEVRQRRIDRQWPQHGRRPHASAARRPGAAGPKASAEHSEGTIEAQRGETRAARLDAQHDSAPDDRRGCPNSWKYLRSSQTMWSGVPTLPAGSNRLKRLHHKG